MQIVPIENIQGRKAVEGGEMCLRKTTNGVDLNRNWGYAWVQVGLLTCAIGYQLTRLRGIPKRLTCILSPELGE